MRSDDKTVSGFKNRIGERLYGTCIRYVRNKATHGMSKKVKKIAIVINEVDGMNNCHRGGITSLIKLMRQIKQKNKN